MPSEGNGSKQKEGAWFIKEESYFFFSGKGLKEFRLGGIEAEKNSLWIALVFLRRRDKIIY